MSAVLQARLTLQAYLDWENAQDDKHELVEGEIFAMTGGRRSHGRVVSNLNRRLSEAMDGSPCQVFTENMKLQVADDTILYPDVFVTCSPADLATEQIFREPTLVIEVLSPSTQAYDRSKKFALYRRLVSLREYILVDPETRRIEAFRRTPADQWVLHDMSDDDTMQAASLGCAVRQADIFAGLDPVAPDAVAPAGPADPAAAPPA